MRKECRVYKGVKIYKVRKVIPNFGHERLKDGTLLRKITNVSGYKYAGGCPHRKVSRCKASINDIYERVVLYDGISEETFRSVMNKKEWRANGKV